MNNTQANIDAVNADINELIDEYQTEMARTGDPDAALIHVTDQIIHGWSRDEDLQRLLALSIARLADA